MKKLLLVLWALLVPTVMAHGQGLQQICLTTNGTNCIKITSSNPFPVTGTISVTFPTIGNAVPSTGVYNAINVAGTLRGLSGLSTGTIFPLAAAIVDASGNQITSFGGANVGATGSAVPASAGYGGLNIAGTLRGWTGANPSGTLYAGQIDVAAVAGVTTATGSGAMTAGTQRTALATDSPGIIALGQAVKAASVPVTFASDQDPCSYAQKSSAAITVTSGTTTSLVAVSGSTTVYVCGFAITIAPSAVTAATALFEYGTGAACTSPTSLTGTFGNGDLTSAAGVAPILYGNGAGTIFKSAASNGICILTAGNAVSVQGVLTYVQQ